MTPSMCVLMADYNRWMNQRLYAAAAGLPADELHRDRGAFFGSLFGTLNHIAAADLIWLHRFAGMPGLAALREAMATLPAPTALAQLLAEDLAGLTALRARIDAVICDQLAARVGEALPGGLQPDTVLRYANTAGTPQAKAFGPLLQHFFNHQTHHRGQASTLLFQAGVDIGVTDLNALIPLQG